MRLVLLFVLFLCEQAFCIELALKRVVCHGEHSKWAPVLSGVPQGSVIGPLLFLIYINDLPEDLRARVRLFADDTIVYMTISNPSDAASLQQDLNKLASWETKWQMKFHPDKCSVLRISRKETPQIHNYELYGHILDSETDSKYLGVTINSKLCWNNHIDNICNKANSSLGFLRRNLQISQQSIKARMHTQRSFDLSWSMQQRCGIPIQKRKQAKLNRYRDALPDMSVTITTAEKKDACQP